jgi:hypothetical protein
MRASAGRTATLSHLNHTRLAYFHSGLVRLLWERGGNAEAAVSIQRDLEDGRIRAVVIDECRGDECPIPPHLWRAARTGAEMYWTGRADVTATDARAPRLGQFFGDIYLANPQPESANAKAADLETRERTTVHKMLLAAVIEAYGYRPNGRSDAASQLAAASERLWPGDGVKDRTIRQYLKAAVEELGDPTDRA